VSPAQVARAYAGLSTGYLPRLFLVDRVGDRAFLPERVHLGLNEVDRERIVASLWVVPRAGGTAAGWGLERWGLACKTGTAELVRGARINNAWLAGFAPAQHGRPAIAFAMVALRTHLHGGEACGPRVAEFLRAFYEGYAQ
jgi:cell division protein FtsI/penicillin-binding protein 2